MTRMFSVWVCAAVLSAVAMAQTYDLSWYTIDGGGGYSAGGSYTLEGTIGQPDAGGPMVGGPYELTGGFWVAGDTGGLCAGDLDGDSITDFNDFAQLSACWGAACGDLTGDNITDFADFAALSADWGCGLP